MQLLMHISDTHFGTEEPAVVQALEELAAAQRPDALVLTGDVTQRARASQFAAARRFVTRLAARHTLVLPGNHDLPLFNLPSRLLTPYAGFRAAFGSALEPRLQTPGLWVAGLCSTRQWRHRNGELSAEQVRASAQFLLQAPPGTLRVVAAHHPLVALDAIDRRHVVKGADAALHAWQAAGVDVVLGGHIHLPYIVPLPSATSRGAASPSTGNSPLWVVQAGTAFSRRLRTGTRHSVNLLRRAADGRWRLERWCHEPSCRAFVLAVWVAL